MQAPAFLVLLSMAWGQLSFAADPIPMVPVAVVDHPGELKLEQSLAQKDELNSRAQAQAAVDPVTIGVGLVLISALINLGKYAWDLIVEGNPAVNFQNDSASAVPQGINSWSELQGWKDPVSKLYDVDLMLNSRESLGKIYFRLVYEAGGNYKGKGKYLANVTVIPADITIPTRRDFYARTSVVQIVNQGSAANPIAGMTILLEWGLTGTLLHLPTIQSVAFHVRGDGTSEVLSTAGEASQELSAPVTVQY